MRYLRWHLRVAPLSEDANSPKNGEAFFAAPARRLSDNPRHETSWAAKIGTLGRSNHQDLGRPKPYHMGGHDNHGAATCCMLRTDNIKPTQIVPCSAGVAGAIQAPLHFRYTTPFTL